MAEGQRRRVLDTGFGPTLLSALTGEVAGHLKERRENEEKIRQLFAAALAQAQAKQLFPSAEEQAQQEALTLTRQLKPSPTPTVPGFGSGFTAQERELGIPEQVEEAARVRNAPTQERLNLLLRLTGRKPEEGIFQQILLAEGLAGARARGTASVQEQREQQKQITGLEARLRELDTSEQGIIGLFQEAEEKAPPISGPAASPGILPISGLTRKGLLAVGFREQAKGFLTTYPVEARKQLRTLEKGGRFTDKDIEQIISASTPAFDESRVARNSKREELVRKVQEERQSIEQQLADLRSGALPTSLSRHQPTTFSSEQEALQSGLPPGTIVVINGRRARID